MTSDVITPRDGWGFEDVITMDGDMEYIFWPTDADPSWRVRLIADRWALYIEVGADFEGTVNFVGMGPTGTVLQITWKGDRGQDAREWWLAQPPAYRTDVRAILLELLTKLIASGDIGSSEHDYVPEPGTEHDTQGPLYCKHCGLPAEGTVVWDCHRDINFSEQATWFRARRQELAVLLHEFVYGAGSWHTSEHRSAYLEDALEIIESHHHLLPLGAQPESWKS